MLSIFLSEFGSPSRCSAYLLCASFALVRPMVDPTPLADSSTAEVIGTSSGSPAVDDKKRHSGEFTLNVTSNATFTSATPPPASTPQRSSSLKRTKDDKNTANARPPRRLHGRTQSIHVQPNAAGKTTTTTTKTSLSQARRGSLPPLQIPNKFAGVDFGSPVRSPFNLSIPPPLPEKLSIQIAHPKSDLAQAHILKHHKNIFENLSYIAMWYFFSTSLSLYNKNLMGKDRFNFNFPLLLSAIHAGLHAVITSAMMAFGGNRWSPTRTTSISRLDYFYKVVGFRGAKENKQCELT